MLVSESVGISPASRAALGFNKNFMTETNMHIDLAGTEIEGKNGLRDYVAKKMQTATARFRSRIQWARVKVAPVDRDGGESDKRCVVQVRLRNLPDVVFSITKLETRAAVDAAADRLSRVLAQRLARNQPAQRRGPSPLPA